jgi:DNA processing protein
MYRASLDYADVMKRSTYIAPRDVHRTTVAQLLAGARAIPPGQGARLGLPGIGDDGEDPPVYFAGDRTLVQRKCVAIVGSRKASDDGKMRARKLAKQLVDAGVVVVSGLAEGIDVSAHRSAIENGGKTIAVIGTPLDKAYPAKHAELQELIYREHLLVTPFRKGDAVYPSNFPQRNKLMAALADATVVIEATDDSGALHQAAECAPKRLNRWLFIARSILGRTDCTWPKKFLDAPGDKVRVLDRVEDVLAVL